MEITNGIAGPYSVRLTGAEALVQGRHAAIVRRYPIAMADAAEADARRLQKLAAAQKREVEKADARLRDAAPGLLDALKLAKAALIAADEGYGKYDAEIDAASAAIARAEGR